MHVAHKVVMMKGVTTNNLNLSPNDHICLVFGLEVTGDDYSALLSQQPANPDT